MDRLMTEGERKELLELARDMGGWEFSRRAPAEEIAQYARQRGIVAEVRSKPDDGMYQLQVQR